MENQQYFMKNQQYFMENQKSLIFEKIGNVKEFAKNNIKALLLGFMFVGTAASADAEPYKDNIFLEKSEKYAEENLKLFHQSLIKGLNLGKYEDTVLVVLEGVSKKKIQDPFSDAISLRKKLKIIAKRYSKYSTLEKHIKDLSNSLDKYRKYLEKNKECNLKGVSSKVSIIVGDIVFIDKDEDLEVAQYLKNKLMALFSSFKLFSELKINLGDNEKTYLNKLKKELKYIENYLNNNNNN